MAVSIKDAQAQLLRSGVLNGIGSTQNDSLPYDSIIEEIVTLWADKSFLPAVKQSIIRERVQASKDLLQSVAPEITIKGDNIVRFTLRMAPHWEFAEHGRKKGKRPPVKAIEKWITNKGIQVRQNKGEEKLSVLQRRRAMAFSIARAIGRRGTIKRYGYKGSKFLSKVAPAEMKALGELCSKALGYAVVIELVQPLRKAKGK